MVLRGVTGDRELFCFFFLVGEKFESSGATPTMSYLLSMQFGEGIKMLEVDGLKEPLSPEDK